MQLFQLMNYQVIFMPQTMMITEFKAIKDKNGDDDTLTLKEMSFVWFYTDVRSDFQQVLDDEERIHEIAQSISMPEEWKPDDIVMNAVNYYKEYSKTASSGLYNASVAAAKFVEKRLSNVEELLRELDARGNPLYKLSDVLRMLKDIPDVMEKLHKARETVIKELEAKSELRGSKTPALFEDGI